MDMASKLFTFTFTFTTVNTVCYIQSAKLDYNDSSQCAVCCVHAVNGQEFLDC